MGELSRVLGRVLIVDDSAAFRHAARLLLTAAGVEVVGEAGSVVEGLRSASSEHPDLVLLDVSLPDGSGLELCGRLADLEPRPWIIVISSREGAGYRAAALANGAVGFLAKAAFSTERLAAIITGPKAS